METRSLAPDVDHWTVLGLNSELFGSGSRSGDQAWAWIEVLAQNVPDSQQVVVFRPKPIWKALDE